jgi:DNA-binding NarL/FixJ family response regulator
MRVLVADDHQLFIDGIALILNKLDAVMEISAATSAEQAIALLESGREFDLVLVDLGMPGMDGMSILRRMHERGVWLPLVVVSAEEDAHAIKSALDAGALGFIPKAHGSQQMLAALKAILDGDVYLPTDIENRINLLERRRTPGNGTITRRQHEVLELLAKGYSNKQIATSLFLTEHTVKAHLHAMFAALNAANRTECVQIAERRGILANPDEPPGSGRPD